MVLQRVVMLLALGGVAALVTYVVRKVQESRNMSQSYQSSSFQKRQEQRISQHNILCTFCNKKVQENDHQLSCGHRYHKSCYQKRSARNRNCTYCRDINEEATISSTQSSRRFSTTNECCYCKFPIQSTEKSSKLDCKHSAHKECYDTFIGFMRCQGCNFEELQKSR